MINLKTMLRTQPSSPSHSHVSSDTHQFKNTARHSSDTGTQHRLYYLNSKTWTNIGIVCSLQASKQANKKTNV